MEEIKNILAGLLAFLCIICFIPLSPIIFIGWVGKSFRKEVLEEEFEFFKPTRHEADKGE